ncbi:MAG: alpha/beta hydrolase [Verrucomicrobia bacterium]|nr:alpha/beta hydrolase [Verrucomicrobiota bacterium]MBV8375535.1 alpha/beta hydrolase [Verrucomicrobiota bacterium]
MKPRRLLFLLLFLLLFCGLTGLSLWFWRVPDFVSMPNPAESYQQAIQKFRAIEKVESTLPLCPEGHSRLLTQGHKTERVFVLLHGLTNCPEQFIPLARILHASGANVVLPRARYAGFSDRMNAIQGLQSGQDLLDQASAGLDIASGLGDRIFLVGLSGSAVAAAWMAHNRDGIESVLLVSPFFGVDGQPVALIDAISAVLTRAPNFYFWWDPKQKAAMARPSCAYPRFGTRCIADTLELSRNVRDHFASHPLRVGRMAILTSACDKAANSEQTSQLAAQWAQKNPGRVSIYEFPKALGIPHDMIDPNQTGAKTQISYPKILELLGLNPTGNAIADQYPSHRI